MNKKNTKKARNIIFSIFNTHTRKNACGLRFTYIHNGKMTCMYSLSTTPYTKDCEEKAKIVGSICHECFSRRMGKGAIGVNLRKAQEKNLEILSSGIIPYEQIPLINALVFRFEAFGDIHNTNQVANYFNICYKNPGVRFALYTKNAMVIKNAIKDGWQKPENLVIVFSSIMLNTPMNVESVKIVFPFVDKIFTVYESADKCNGEINCGSLNCFECQRCYHKTDDIEMINELLK